MPSTSPAARDDRRADVVVVGAGPAGASTAYHLARAGLDVLLLEKAAFPRDKVCGDGLTPRAVRALIEMGVDVSAPGWTRNKGLRIVGAGHRIELPWPSLASFPDYGLVRTRADLDELLARHAAAAGARLHERTQVTRPLVENGRVVGVAARCPAEPGRGETTYHAPVVIACDGVSARLATSLGVHRREDRPMGVAVRAYYSTPRHDDEWMESWLELWDGAPGASDLLPGYGWIFGVGDGTANVGLGILNTSRAFGHVDYRDVLRRWLDHTPEEWGFREEHRVGRIGSAALPMAFNRTPHVTHGMLLVGDAGGMVNPFNGEGIDYALESGQLAAEVVARALRCEAGARDAVLAEYGAGLASMYGGYFTLGRVFAKLIGNPTFMKQATRHGLPRTALMKALLKLMANLTDPHDGDVSDRVINTLSKLAPAA